MRNQVFDGLFLEWWQLFFMIKKDDKYKIRHLILIVLIDSGQIQNITAYVFVSLEYWFFFILYVSTNPIL